MPVELLREQNISLVRDYVKINFVDSGMCADICIHDKKDGNPHAHILLTMRPFNKDKSWGDKQRKEYILDKNGNKIYDPKKRQYKCKSVPATDWNEQTKAEEWRATWAQSVNKVLEHNDHAERVDHRSYERRGIEQVPTVHMGVAATQMESKGILTERGNMNREIAIRNNLIQRIMTRIKRLKDWLKEALVPTLHRVEKPSVMAQLSQYKKEIKEPKDTRNTEPSVLVELRARFHAAHENLKQIDRRLKNSKGLQEFDKILVKRRKTYNEYSALKSELKKAEARFPNKKPRSRDWER